MRTAACALASAMALAPGATAFGRAAPLDAAANAQPRATAAPEPPEAQPAQPDAEPHDPQVDASGVERHASEIDEPAVERSEPEVASREPSEDPDDPGRLAPGERMDAAGGAPVAGRSRTPADAPTADVPERMRPMQAAGWWTLFGAFAAGTGAGVFAGLATRQQDRAQRMATVFEPGTGRQPLWSDKREEYESILRRGRAYQGTAIALGAVAGATAVAAVVLFIVDERRRKRGVATELGWLPTGVRVRF